MPKKLLKCNQPNCNSFLGEDDENWEKVTCEKVLSFIQKRIDAGHYELDDTQLCDYHKKLKEQNTIRPR